MAQLYVMLPGNPQPQLLEIEEIVRRIRAGELPDTANAARLGETTWSPLKDLTEVTSQLSSAAAGSAAGPSQAGSEPIPPGPSSLGAPLWSPGGAVGPSQAGQSPGLPPTQASASPTALTGPMTTAAAPKSGLPVGKGVIIGGAGGLFVLLLGIILLVWYRNSYSRGLVFEHVPDNCGNVVYVDIEGIATSNPLKPHLEKLIKNLKDQADDELEKSSKKDKERFQRALDALDKNGVTKTSVREFAVCMPLVDEDEKDKAKLARPEEHGLLLIGGTWRKGDVLQGLKEAIEAGTGKEDICKLDDDDGLRLLKCSMDFKGGKKDPVYAALVDGRVLAVSPDKKLIKSVRPAKDRAKNYDANKGEHLVVWTSSAVPSYDGAFGSTKLKVSSDATTLTVDTRYDPEKGKKKLESLNNPDEAVKKREKNLKSLSEKCFEKSDFEVLADSVEKAKVDVFEDGIRYEFKVPNKDLGKAIKFLSDADRNDLKKFSGIPWCVGYSLESSVASY